MVRSYSMAGKSRALRGALLGSAALLSCMALAPAALAVVPGGQGDDAENVVDTNDVNGVGQMIIDQQNGFIGLCTGTLINPRTVIFAAHCVNEGGDGEAKDPATYGAQFDGTPIAFGFHSDTFNSFVNWLNGGYHSDPSDYLYNVNQVVYNPDSLALGLGSNFLQADVALATLDTPAKNVPTWTILLSALTAPNAISDAQGTGYHVTITGYGLTGDGYNGDYIDIDFRRRVAENFIGALGSLDDLEGFIFGSTEGLPQNLYQIDFDDPNRSDDGYPFDFNLFKDDATESEGITGEGDSGGPLILDHAFDEKTVIGVLSGGFPAFFNGQATTSYGSSSFYQPLYLFWDYIAANNPYRYVSAKAGDGNWSDPDHWVTELDPAYRILDADGDLVNGIPTAPGEGINGTDGKFGQICFQQPGVDECTDLATGEYLVDGEPVALDGEDMATGAAASNDKATVSLDSLAQASKAGDKAQSGGVQTAAAGEAEAPTLPTPTLENGLPDASGFVPDNVDPDPTVGRKARYFDVTLSQDGTTTLDDSVTVDRLTLTGSAGLDISADGSLESLMDVTQTGGLLNLNGTLASNGDYLLLTGLLSGSGTINAPYTTSIGGMIAPGTLGGIGTLDVNGNLILASANALLIDLGDDGTSDRVAVHANAENDTAGIASIGGHVGFLPATGAHIRYGDEYTILTAEGGVEGTFDTPEASLGAILKPVFSYRENAVDVTIDAGLYADVVDRGSLSQRSFATLLDANRGQYDNYATLYGQLDFSDAKTIQSTLEAWAPRLETTRTMLGIAATDNAASFYRNRLQMIGTGEAGGTLALMGQPVQLAALHSGQGNRAMGGGAIMSDTPEDVSMTRQVLPDDMSGFIAAGYIDGHSRRMPGLQDYDHDSFDGYFVAGGLEKMIERDGSVGLSFSYSSLDGDGALGDRASGDLYLGTLYSVLRPAGQGLVLDTQISAGLFSTRTWRSLSIGAQDYQLRSKDDSLAFTGEAGLGYEIGMGTGAMVLTPRAAIRTAYIGFDRAKETGGDAALVYGRKAYSSFQGRAGLNLAGRGISFRPHLSANYVHDFLDNPATFGANLVGGIGSAVPFALASRDQNWGEISGGLTVRTGAVDIGVSADTTVWRKDVSDQSYRATISLHF